ncbi:MAG: hypothetical protein K6E10_03410 [Eubacterium sp.]|nr:hypothetical protein [Eubacterium sp.]
MRLLIHDFDEIEWNKVSDKYKGWEIISDDGSIKPCIGCFGCWIKTPGKCLIKDSYDKMGALIHKADELLVISRYTYGGFSPFIKNVFVRSIGWVLPFFEVINNEMHHKSRYPEEKPISFIFRGSNLTEEDKAMAQKYVKAVCLNFHGIIKDISFQELDDELKSGSYDGTNLEASSEKALLINCSLRADNANTKKILTALSDKLSPEKEIINLSSYMSNMESILPKIKASDRIILGIPLYVDGIPSHVLRLMKMIEISGSIKNKKIYIVTNMGFYESSQEENLLAMARKWTEDCDAIYGGGLGIGAGEMVCKMIDGPAAEKGPSKNAALALNTLAQAINGAESIEDIYVNPYMFPRSLYMLAANSGWTRGIKANGLKKKDLYNQIN